MKSLNRDWYGLLSGRAASRRGGTAFWLILAALVIALNLYAPASPTLIERVLASAIALFAFGVIWRWTYRGDGRAELGFLPTMLVIYFLENALSIFTQKFYQMNFDFGDYLLDSAAIDKALVLSLVGVALIVGGYYWPGRTKVAEVLPRFQMRWRDRNAVLLTASAFMAIGLLAFLIFYRSSLDASKQAYLSLIGDFFFPSLIALFILQLEGELNLGLTLLLWGVLIPARMVMGMAQGQFGLGMFVAMALVITYTTIRRRVPWFIFLVGFLAFVMMQPVKSSLRQSVFLKGDVNKEQAQSEKVVALFDSAQRGLVVLQTFELKDVIALATQRLDDILVFATLVERTPDQVPYWGGSSYYRLLFVAIPRILFPEKPDYIEGNVFGHQYAMLQSDDYVTSINLPQVAELYGNFGPIGLIVGCVLLGIVYRTIHDCFLHEHAGLGAIVAGLYLFTHLLDIENSTAAIFGGLLIESITVVIFHCSIRVSEAILATIRLNRPIAANGFGVRLASSAEKIR